MSKLRKACDKLPVLKGGWSYRQFDWHADHAFGTVNVNLAPVPPRSVMDRLKGRVIDQTLVKPTVRSISRAMVPLSRRLPFSSPPSPPSLGVKVRLETHLARRWIMESYRTEAMTASKRSKEGQRACCNCLRCLVCKEEL